MYARSQFEIESFKDTDINPFLFAPSSNFLEFVKNKKEYLNKKYSIQCVEKNEKGYYPGLLFSLSIPYILSDSNIIIRRNIYQGSMKIYTNNFKKINNKWTWENEEFEVVYD